MGEIGEDQVYLSVGMAVVAFEASALPNSLMRKTVEPLTLVDGRAVASRVGIRTHDQGIKSPLLYR